MKKYRTAVVLRPTETQPGPRPPSHVETMTAIAKKNQKGFPNRSCKTRDKPSAVAVNAIASP
jgi:hypothetical protein